MARERTATGWALLAWGVLAAAVEAKGAKLPEIPWRDTPELKVEKLGRPAGTAVFAELPAVPIPGQRGAFLKPFAYRAGGRKLHFRTLNLQTGRVKAHEAIAGHEVWRTLPLDGKLYLGLNLPAALIEYDPATDAFRERGVYSQGTVTALVATPDGKVAVGLANGPIKVLVHDPATGRSRDYGVLSKEHGFVYELTADDRHLYAALRGPVPWQLVSVERASGKQKVVLTAPAGGYINLGSDARGPVARVAQDAHDRKKPRASYRLRGMEAVAIDKEEPPAPLAAPAPLPEVLVDDAAAHETRKVRVHYRLPGDRPKKEVPKTPPAKAGWKTAEIEVELEPKLTARLLLWDERTIVGATHGYGPLFVYDLTANTVRFPGMSPGMNVYSMARAGKRLYMSGYPNSGFAVADLGKAFTSPLGAPDRPGIDWQEPRANPRLLKHLGHVEGLNAHTGVAIHPGADGRLYTLAMRHRYARGSDLAWYDPGNGKFGVVDDGGRLDHLQASWVAPLEGGKRLVLSTRLAPDPEARGKPPKAGKLLVFNTATGKYEKEYTPFLDEPRLGAVVEVKPGLLMGLIALPSHEGGKQVRKTDRTTIYLFDLRQGKVLRTRSYADVLCGVPGLHGIPWHGYSFERGPDGHVWTVDKLPWADAPEQFVRIHPEQLTVQPVGKIPPSGWVRFVFVGRDIYFTGASQLRRVRDVVPR